MPKPDPESVANPSIAIVIPVLNGAAYIRRAIESALTQGIDKLEIIVVDGGSTDGTQAIASEEGAILLSAPRSSIYEALNLGITSSRAPIIGHLNSDDRLPSGTLKAVAAAAAAHPDAGIIRGRATFVATDRNGTMSVLEKHARHVSCRWSLDALTFGVPAINGCFVRRRTYEEVGLYDTTFAIAADREWLLRCLFQNVPVEIIDHTLYEYLAHAGSKTIGGGKRAESVYAHEHLLIAERYLAEARSRKERRNLLSWHAQELMRFIVRAPDARTLGKGMAHGFAFSPIWPLYSLIALYRYAFRQF